MSATEQTTTVSRPGSIVSVQVGHVAPLGPRRVPSAFVKRPISGRVMVQRLGLVGDQQADLRAHGGPDKAVYCYPIEHYAKWLAERPSAEALLVPGGFGENLTTLGFDEDGVCIGDILSIGSVTAQVAQPRTPCFKLGLRFANMQMLRAMTRSGAVVGSPRARARAGRSWSVDYDNRSSQPILAGRAVKPSDSWGCPAGRNRRTRQSSGDRE